MFLIARRAGVLSRGDRRCGLVEWIVVRFQGVATIQRYFPFKKNQLDIIERLRLSRTMASKVLKSVHNLKLRGSLVATLASGVVLLSIMPCQTARAQGSFPESGTAILADSFGIATGAEALTVNWTVTESDNVYTYSYTIENPAGDVVLHTDGSATTTPEIVDDFSVAFDTTVAGAYVASTQTGGTFQENNGTDGLFWVFDDVYPGSSSPTLSFESDLPPVLGDAEASGEPPPSPWSSIPNGDQVPIPAVVPEPATLMLVAGSLLLFPRLRHHRKFIVD